MPTGRSTSPSSGCPKSWAKRPSRVPAAERGHYPGIPWPQIVSLRNRLIHGYDNVDFDILWQIITYDLPPLIAELEKIL